jgi:hypothetical protein
MLDPRSRQMLLASLRPPDGFRFDSAVATTFSLDLIALLTAPLAFAMFDWQDDDGRLAVDPHEGTGDPLVLLESLRRCSDRIHIYCQAGQIKVPPANQRLLPYLERSVLEVLPPGARRGRPGVFHPKIWVMRYQAADDPEHVRYRLLCLSRNLTFDASWDTALVLDGELADRQRGIADNRPLAEFVGALPGLVLRPEAMTEQARADTVRMADELRVVKWELPEHVEAVRFWPLGLTGKSVWPFEERIERLLVVAPFVTPEFLQRIGEVECNRFLVSRPETLRAIDPKLLSGGWSCFLLEDGCDAIAAAEVADQPAANSLSGLHAKLFVADDGWNAHVWTGSANATTAAFEHNVEFLVQMTGKKSKLGVDTVLGEGGTEANLRSLLVPFEPQDQPVVVDAATVACEQRLDRVRRQLTLTAMDLLVEAGGKDGAEYTTTLRSAEAIDPTEGIVVRCRPATMVSSDARAVPMGTPMALAFGPHAAATISSFVAFEVAAKVDGVERVEMFVRNLPLQGAPVDRRERLLRELLSDSDTLLRFLLLLLADEPEQVLSDLRGRLPGEGGEAAAARRDALPLLEHLLASLHRCPSRLDQVRQVLDDLRRSADGRSLVLPDLEAIWEPIEKARAALAARSERGRR